MLRPLDRLPGLNTATILVGISSPDSRARLSSWAALQRPGPLRRSEILARAAPAGVWWAGEPLLNQSELAALLTAGARAQGGCRWSKTQLWFSPCIRVRPPVETRLSQGGFRGEGGG